MNAVKGKTAIVTGGASGIGAAIVRLFASEGANVVIADRDGAQARALAQELTAAGGQVTAATVDIANAEDCSRLAEVALGEFSRLDVLVCSAGIGVQRSFLTTSLEEWQRIIDVNLTGAFLCGQAAARVMREQMQGRIINIASGAGIRGVPGRSAYGASKGGMIMLTKVMAAELGIYGITANAIAPGPIETPLTARMHSAETRSAYLASTPLHRYGTLEEVASAALYLASDGAGYITGHTIEVDGGMASSGPLFKVD